MGWRRLYTISWLFDLVNLFSAIFVQRNTMRGENHVNENVDWLLKGPWYEHTRLFGLDEVAGDITSFAMQKPNTGSTKDIPAPRLPAVVYCRFLYCSRGCTVSSLRGHIVAAPPRTLRPRRDVDLFLDRASPRFRFLRYGSQRQMRKCGRRWL